MEYPLEIQRNAMENPKERQKAKELHKTNNAKIKKIPNILRNLCSWVGCGSGYGLGYIWAVVLDFLRFLVNSYDFV